MNKVVNLLKIYNQGKENECRALDGVSFDFEQGEMIAVVGHSGSGKSTLLNIIAGLLMPDGGDVIVDGMRVAGLSPRDLAEYRNKKVGIIRQDYLLADSLSVVDNVILPLYFVKMSDDERLKRVADMLDRLGIKNKANQKAGRLSGGEKQRAAIARALINNPAILLADEPTGALDSKNGNTVMEILKEINLAGQTVIIVTHNQDIANQCKRTITLADGKIVSV